ncbi:hypothetical protein SDC9_176831 [bioreactor metagenome]|uniref:Peptidase S11 D-Ala-D-Ala carboxypeptidase A C-terminal domain-containing protein n=1 Tax=bioreactor metagenome TaxID=1076179 RepID=A0A645GR52_9ZZZZ
MIVPISSDDKEQFRTIIDAPAKIEAPVVAGQKLGVARILYKDTEIGTVDLIATETVERKTFFGMLWGSVWNFFTFVVKNFA